MLNLALTIALTLMVTVSGNPNPTYPTNPTTKYCCEFVNLNCIYTLRALFRAPASTKMMLRACRAAVSNVTRKCGNCGCIAT